MKKILLLLFLCLCAAQSDVWAQIAHGGMPYGLAHPDGLVAEIPQVSMPAVDVEALRAEDALLDGKGNAWRFGYKMSVDISLQNAGVWETLDNGDRVWRVEIRSKHARTINLQYERFYMPPGARFHLYSPGGSSLLGAFNSTNNKKHGQFATGFVTGDVTVLEYYEPAGVVGQGVIQVSSVVHGYRGIGSPGLEKGFNDSGSCNNNVNCPEGADWQNEKRSVALIIEGGFSSCTGSLLNNVREDCRPFFITANHCLGGNINQWMAMFNYESPNCNNINGPNNQTVSGMTLLANASFSDFALLELSEAPPPDYNVYYAGWSAEDVAATSSVAIHHPSGDIKKITFNEDPLVSIPGNTGLPNAHWEVTEWEDGTTEGGSSGSPMYDQNHRFVGQLFGGTASCFNTNGYDEYGKFAVSWDHGTSAGNRAKDWLDPDNTGSTIMDGRNCGSPDFAVDAAVIGIQGVESILCNQSEITPSVTIRNQGADDLTGLSISYSINGGLPSGQLWAGSLATFQSETVALPTISLGASGQYTLTVTVTSPNGTTDLNFTNNTVEQIFEVVDGDFLTLNLNTDNFAEETSVSIQDQDGNIVYVDESFADGTNYVLDYCLTSGCYEFIIEDSEDDGICCGFGMGNYSLSIGGAVVFESGGNFGSSESHSFCIDAVGIGETGKEPQMGLAVTQSTPAGILQISNSNPMGERAVLEILDISGRKVLDTDLKAGDNRIDLNNTHLPKGVYVIRMSTAKGTLSQKIVFAGH